MLILDTPQWAGLNQAQKRMVGLVYGQDTGDGFKTALSPGARKVVETLEADGLLTVAWRERDVTIRLREAGWSR